MSQEREINAERINIVDREGRVRLALFNPERMPDWIVGGVTYAGREKTEAGLVFYDGEGNECGGLVFGSATDADGHHSQGLSMTFDGYQQDQLLQLRSVDRDGGRLYGLVLTDRPQHPITEDLAMWDHIKTMEEGAEKEMAVAHARSLERHRAVFGRQEDGTVELALYDGYKRPRIRMTVGLEGNPALEFLDAEGRVTYRLAPGAAGPDGDTASPAAGGDT